MDDDDDGLSETEKRGRNSKQGIINDMCKAETESVDVC